MSTFEPLSNFISILLTTIIYTHLTGSFASLRATFSFRRRTESFVSAIYVPAVVLVVLSWCCFFIQPDAVPARIGLSITTILTSILLQGSVNSNMPKVSYMKAVDYFLLTSFGFIFAALLEYILVLNIEPEFDVGDVCKRRNSEQLDLINVSIDSGFIIFLTWLCIKIITIITCY